MGRGAQVRRQVLAADGWDSDRKVVLPVELSYSVPTVAEESHSASASSSTAGTVAPRNTFEVRSFILPQPAAAAQEPPKEWAGLIDKTAPFVAIQPTEGARQEYSDRTLCAQDPEKYRFLKAEDDLNVFSEQHWSWEFKSTRNCSLRGRGRRSHSLCGLRSTCRTGKGRG